MSKFKAGDMVKMVGCGEADHYEGRVWECINNAFMINKNDEAVHLKGFSGAFITRCLEKVETNPVNDIFAVHFDDDQDPKYKAIVALLMGGNMWKNRNLVTALHCNSKNEMLKILGDKTDE